MKKRGRRFLTCCFCSPPLSPLEDPVSCSEFPTLHTLTHRLTLSHTHILHPLVPHPPPEGSLMTQLSDKADVLPQTKQLISLNQLPACKDWTGPNRADNRSGPKARSRDYQAPCQTLGACQSPTLHLRQGLDRVVTLPSRPRTWQVGGSVSPDRCFCLGAGPRRRTRHCL